MKKLTIDSESNTYVQWTNVFWIATIGFLTRLCTVHVWSYSFSINCAFESSSIFEQQSGFMDAVNMVLNISFHSQFHTKIEYWQIENFEHKCTFILC
jgi:hypothetical protein